MENTLTALFPTKCSFCSKNVGQICPSCLFSAKQVIRSFCIVCEQASSAGKTHRHCISQNSYVPKSIYSPYKYEKIVRECIKRAKYTARLFYPLKRLSYEGSKLLSKSGASYKDFILVPIPLSKRKERSRGFNQAQIIAEVVAKQLKASVEDKLLFRVVATKVQHASTRKDRYRNIKGAFKSKNANNTKILLVDDICTSGATFFEASKALYEAGAKEVHCFSLAKKFLFKNLRSAL